ncbi:hypothetical protein TCAL_16035 [Tigriopus californicus]|uniref:Uncharacterized protein n=1 Tax=Tigriopus californicus TaxID=6832 RepID=A0A553PQT6_TIGCA|nr:hypothetical protein TCAL_16035 [Tigriopus californicus]
MNKLIITVLASLFLGVCDAIPFPFSHKCPCENCWEKCFSKPPHPSFADEYAQLYQFFSRVQSDRVLSGAESSVLLIDLSIPQPQSIFQKNLVKLATFALNSGRKCHPTAISGYTRWGAFALNVQCPTACDMVDIIDSLPDNIPYGPPNLLGISCLLGNFAMNLDPFKCKFDDKRYAVAFTNEIQWGVPFCYIFPVRLEVETRFAPPPSLFAPTFTTGTSGQEQFIFTNSLLTASKYLVDCIRKTCCYNKPWDTIEHAVKGMKEARASDNRSEDGASEDVTEGTIYYIDAKDSKDVKKTEGNLREFLAEKERDVDPCVVIPSENEETGEGCMGELCNDPAYLEECPQNCEKCSRG